MAREEIIDPSLAITKQYLEINEVLFEGGLPKVHFIDADEIGFVYIYIPIKDEKYFLTISLTKQPQFLFILFGLHHLIKFILLQLRTNYHTMNFIKY